MTYLVTIAVAIEAETAKQAENVARDAVREYAKRVVVLAVERA